MDLDLIQYFVEERVRIFLEEQKKTKELKMRVCNICEIEKDITEYNLTKDGKYKYKCCKSCYSIKRKEQTKRYCEKNKEVIKEKGRIYYIENKDVLYEKHRKWVEENNRNEYTKKWREENKEDIKIKNDIYFEKNKELIYYKKKEKYKSLTDEQKKMKNEKSRLNYHNNIENNRKNKNEYIKNRMLNEPLFKLAFNIRTLIRNSIKRQFTEKSKKTQEILGCSFEEFKIHLESMFDDNMNWDNQGTYWHLDHIKPISLAIDKEEVYKLNHYTNFQPLYWKDNLTKSNNYL